MRKTRSRPGIWIGHVTRRVRDIAKSADFFEALGLRKVWKDERMAIFELRGGTHLLLFQDKAPYKNIPNDNFDLMVENVEATRELLQSKGIKLSKLKSANFHTYVEASDPDGHKWRINSDHTEGRTV